MVHYIRFLSTPQVSVTQKRTINISAPLAVTTDLGDAYLTEDAELVIQVIDVQSGAALIESKHSWKNGSRALKTVVQCDGKFMRRSVRVHVTTTATRRSLESTTLPKIMDVWSWPFDLVDKVRSEPVVCRQIPLKGGSSLCIWEETGDSIARHVWDAGLGFLVYFDRALEDMPATGATQLHERLRSKASKPLQVLELGTGCGTAGIAFAQLLECNMLLTDLDDAMDILQKNIVQAAPVSKSDLRCQVLDWGTELDPELKQNYDIILVSDCIYNPDSSVRLVETLLHLTRGSDALVVVGFKRRHSGDDVFFEHMSSSEFRVIETHDVALPHIASDYDAYKPVIEFHIFKGPA